MPTKVSRRPSSEYSWSIAQCDYTTAGIPSTILRLKTDGPAFDLEFLDARPSFCEGRVFASTNLARG
jgi:hypothetical protein